MSLIFHRITAPKTPTYPQQVQSTLVYPNYTPSSAQRPVSVSLTKKSHVSVGSLCNVETTIHDDSPEASPTVRRISITKQQDDFRQRNISHDDEEEEEEDDDDDEEEDDHLHVHQIIDSILPEQINPIESPLKSNENLLQDDKPFYRTSSLTSSRRSSDRFPPPPQNLEILDSSSNENHHHHHQQQQQQRSSFHDQEEDELYSPEVNLIRKFFLNKFSFSS